MSHTRELKFRFWSGDRMFYNLEQVMECLKQQMAHDAGLPLPIPYDHVGRHGAAFMQFTGLKDKEGKEIYEGDCLRDRIGRVRVVAWIDTQGRWGIMNGDTTYYSLTQTEANDNEKIGDVYSNPELLKQ